MGDNPFLALFETSTPSCQQILQPVTTKTSQNLNESQAEINKFYEKIFSFTVYMEKQSSKHKNTIPCRSQLISVNQRKWQFEKGAELNPIYRMIFIFFNNEGMVELVMFEGFLWSSQDLKYYVVSKYWLERD